MVGILGANSVSGGGYEIDNSLRFNSGDSPKLTKTFSAGNRKTFTISTWFKRSDLDQPISILDIYTDASNWLFFGIHHGNKLLSLYQGDSGTDYGYITTQVFRDSAAFYHICLAVDTTQSTAADRVKLFVNGSEVSFEQNYGEYPQNYDTWVNSTVSHGIGIYSDASKYTSGYMSEYNFLDGVAKVASDFGEFNDNGVWIPKAYEGTYGTNGFYLQFKQTGTSQNSSGIGADTSGNDNHFAVTNLAATDVTTDTPTNNFATWNINTINPSTTNTFAQGNLQCTSGGAISTFAMPSGKWYWEIRCNNSDADQAIGVYSVTESSQISISGGADPTHGFIYQANGNARKNGTVVETWSTFTNGDIISFAYDSSTRILNAYKNNSFVGDITVTDSGDAYSPNVMPLGGNFIANFGQEGSFAGTATAQGNTDDNDQGDFYYAVPSGYYSLCTKNLAEFG